MKYTKLEKQLIEEMGINKFVLKRVEKIIARKVIKKGRFTMGKEHDFERENAKIEIISGCEGNCVSFLDFRIAGNKPWGGGRVSQSYNTTIERVLTAIAITHSEEKKVYKFWRNGKYKVTFEKIKE